MKEVKHNLKSRNPLCDLVPRTQVIPVFFPARVHVTRPSSVPFQTILPKSISFSLGEALESIMMTMIATERTARFGSVINSLKSSEAKMRNCRVAFLLCGTLCLLGGALPVSSAEAPQLQAKEDERAVWKLEHAYWRYVQENDLRAYSGLWHKDILGWPSVNVAPVRKDHITDWITSQTSRGLAFKTLELKPAAIQVTGDDAVAFYWVTFKWVDKNGKGATQTVRVMHAWLRDGKEWRIIGGMSMPETAARPK